MSKKNAVLENLLQDLERTRRKQKICKKTINDSMNSVIEVLKITVANINNSPSIEEVTFFTTET